VQQALTEYHNQQAEELERSMKEADVRRRG
jgi:hypothetical protein